MTNEEADAYDASDSENADDDGIEEKSKSQIKREKLAILDLVETLCGLPNKKLTTIPLSEHTSDIVARIRRMPMRDARRRELRFLAKQLTDEEKETVTAAITRFEQGSRDKAKEFHRIELLRDLVIKEPSKGIADVIAEWPSADRQLLNQLARNSRKEQAAEKPPANARKLFKYIRSLTED